VPDSSVTMGRTIFDCVSLFKMDLNDLMGLISYGESASVSEEVSTAMVCSQCGDVLIWVVLFMVALYL
jgi:hypothetical protein